jgi:2C-methyl-D-erythritol 2,4-cyclodiphosphate synthase
MKDLEINSMQNENILRDELDLVKDKNNKLLKLEATLEVYKNKLKEIPELKAKLTQALRANLEYENLKGEQKIE